MDFSQAKENLNWIRVTGCVRESHTFFFPPSGEACGQNQPAALTPPIWSPSLDSSFFLFNRKIEILFNNHVSSSCLFLVFCDFFWHSRAPLRVNRRLAKMTSGSRRSWCFRTSPGRGPQMAGQNGHHSSSAAWYAPYETRHTPAKITNWPALRANPKCVPSSRDIWRSKGWKLSMERGGEEVGHTEMADRGSKGTPERPMQPICAETLQMLECLPCQRCSGWVQF